MQKVGKCLTPTAVATVVESRFLYLLNLQFSVTLSIATVNLFPSERCP